MEMLILVDRVDAKMTKMEDWLKGKQEETGKAVGTLAVKVGTLDASVKGLAEKEGETRKAVGELAGPVGKLDVKVGALDASMKGLGDKQEGMSEEMGALAGMVGKLDVKVDVKVGALEAAVKGLEGKQEETGKMMMRGQAVGSAVVILASALAAVLAQAPLIKNLLESV